MTDILQNVVSGLVLGAVYGGLALGLSLVFGILGVVNIAHSALLTLGALLYWQLVAGAGIDLFVAILPVVAVMFLVGMGIQRTIAQRVEREAATTGLLVFFGLMVVVESVAVLVWSTDTRNIPLQYLDGTLRLAGVGVPVARLVAAVLTLILFMALHLFLTRTLTGAAIRGIAQNRDVAEMVGIDVRRFVLLVLAGGVGLAGFGGVVLALSVPFTPQDHVRWLAWAFLVVIIGGLGNVLNTLLAGLFLGLLESFIGSLLSFQYTYLAIYVLLALALLYRREGFRGATARTL